MQAIISGVSPWWKNKKKYENIPLKTHNLLECSTLKMHKPLKFATFVHNLRYSKIAPTTVIQHTTSENRKICSNSPLCQFYDTVPLIVTDLVVGGVYRNTSQQQQIHHCHVSIPTKNISWKKNTKNIRSLVILIFCFLCLEHFQFPMLFSAMYANCFWHRASRVLSFFSSRRNWDLPTTHPQASVPPTLWFRGEGHTR